MISKNQIKLIKALKLKKKREENECFVAEGHKTVSDILHSALEIIHVYGHKDWIDKHMEGLNVPFTEVTEKELQQMSSLKTAQEVLALVKMPQWESAMPDDSLVLALDGVRDPGNLGTIIRLADWYGVKQIICSTDCVDVYNPKTVQATMGSIARVKVEYTALAHSIQELKSSGYRICTAVLEGDNMYRLPFEDKIILIMGNESQGVRPEIAALADQGVRIPDFGTGEIDSLNVATATAVLLSEIRSRAFR